MKQKLHALLEIVRVFLTPSAVADSFAGYHLAHVITHSSNASLRPCTGPDMLQLCGALACSVLLYWLGMTTNDLFDLKRDRRSNPGRPLPSGRVTRTEVTALCVVLAVGATSIAVALDVWPVALGVLACILLYDCGGKRIFAVGSALMGACRAGNFLLGAAAACATTLSLGEPRLMTGAALLALYITGVTAISVLEDHEFDRKRLIRVAAPLLGLPIVLVAMRYDSPLNWANATALTVLLLNAIRTACRAGESTRADDARAPPHGAAIFVRTALGGIFLLDAGFLIALTPEKASLVSETVTLYALFALAWIWKHRWIRAGAMGS